MNRDDGPEKSVIPSQVGRKTTDRAMLLPLLGSLLLLPPLAGIFQLDIRLFGIPFTAIYLFVVWGLLILGAVFLARPLGDHAGWLGDRGRDDAGHD